MGKEKFRKGRDGSGNPGGSEIKNLQEGDLANLEYFPFFLLEQTGTKKNGLIPSRSFLFTTL